MIHFLRFSVNNRAKVSSRWMSKWENLSVCICVCVLLLMLVFNSSFTYFIICQCYFKGFDFRRFVFRQVSKHRWGSVSSQGCFYFACENTVSFTKACLNWFFRNGAFQTTLSRRRFPDVEWRIGLNARMVKQIGRRQS